MEPEVIVNLKTSTATLVVFCTPEVIVNLETVMSPYIFGIFISRSDLIPATTDVIR